MSRLLPGIPVLFVVALIAIALLAPRHAAAQGSLVPPGPPGTTMHSLDEIYAGVTNVSGGMSAVTNAVLSVDWPSIESMALDMSSITNRIGSVNWMDIACILSALSNQTTGLGHLVQVISNVNWDCLVELAKDMHSVTQRMGQWDWNEIAVMATNIDRVVWQTDRIASVVSNVDWRTLECMAADMASITQHIGNVSWPDLTARMDRLGSSIAYVTAVLSNVDWAAVMRMGTDMVSVTARVAQCQGTLDRLDRNVTLLTNAFFAVNWAAVSNLQSEVAGIGAQVRSLDARTAWATNEVARQAAELQRVRQTLAENTMLLNAILTRLP